MATANYKTDSRWKDAANLLLGIWLGLSPTALAYMDESTRALNTSIVGIVIAVLATAAFVRFRKWEEWLNAALGGWLIVSPFVLGYFGRTESVRNQLVVGLLVCGLALWSALAKL